MRDGLCVCPRCHGAGKIVAPLKDYQAELAQWVNDSPEGVTIAAIEAKYSEKGEIVSASAIYGRLMRLANLGVVRIKRQAVPIVWQFVE